MQINTGAIKEDMPMERPNRRKFLGGFAAGVAGIPLMSASGTSTAKGDMPYRMLGRTGAKVSLLGMGGWQFGRMASEEESTRFIRTGIDEGINYIEAAWDYHSGLSEYRMGKGLMDGWRKKVFIATKINGRRREIAEWQLNESLQRLRTDVIDLVILHEVLRLEEPEIIFGPGGALETFVAAKKAGKIRFVGFSGHYDPAVQLKLLDLAAKNNFRFDVGMIALNVMDPHYKSFGKQVLPRLVEQEMGVIAFKTMGGGNFLGPDNVLQKVRLEPADCLRFVMNLPTSVVISGMDRMEVLKQNIETARNFRPLSEPDVSELLSKTAPVGNAGQYEWFKGPAGLRRSQEIWGTYV
jgi:predicted aldo/keto reductase-like oxidoreductase